MVLDRTCIEQLMELLNQQTSQLYRASAALADYQSQLDTAWKAPETAVYHRAIENLARRLRTQAAGLEVLYQQIQQALQDIEDEEAAAEQAAREAEEAPAGF